MQIVYSVPALVPCGGIVHYLSVIQQLAARGHRVSIYAPYIEDLEFLPAVPESVPILRHAKVRSNLYSLPSERRLSEFVRTFLDLTRGLDSISRDLPSNADIVVAGFYPNAIAASRMRRRTGSHCRIIQEMHTDPDYFLPHSYRRRYYRIWAQAPFLVDHIITVNDSLADKLRRKYQKPVTVVGNGVDDCYFESTNPETSRVESLLSSEGRPYVLCVGSLGHRKGTDILLKAFSRVRQERPDLLLVLIGRGFWEQYYRHLAADLGLLEHVRHVPGLETEVLRDVLDCASVFAFPSRHEGFGIPPLEAMARGIPVVCTECGGPSVYARNEENCLVVPAEDPDALAIGIQRLLADADLAERLSEGGIRTAQFYTWKRVADLTEQAMLRCLENGSSR